MNVCGCSGSQHRYNSPSPAIHAKDTAEATRDRFMAMQCSREGELLMDAVQQSQGRQNDEGNLRAFQLCCFHTVFLHNFLLAGSPAQTLDLTRSKWGLRQIHHGWICLLVSGWTRLRGLDAWPTLSNANVLTYLEAGGVCIHSLLASTWYVYFLPAHKANKLPSKVQKLMKGWFPALVPSGAITVSCNRGSPVVDVCADGSAQ